MSIANVAELNHVRQVARQRTERCDRILLACDNTLDCEAISHWLAERGGYLNVLAVADWAAALGHCQERCVALFIADVLTKGFDLAEAIEALRAHQTASLLVLDDCPREGRLTSVLSLPGVSYISRKAGATELLLTLEDILHHGRRVFDPALAGRVRRTTKGFQLQSPKDGTSISQLSKRELQVMLLLAKGSSVREAADTLNLSASTVDNHRSRLMKKLDVHKAAELTYRAVRDGLLTV